MSIDMSHRSFSSKKLAMVAAANILRIAIGLAITTSGQNPVRQEGQAPTPAVVGEPAFGWG